MNDRHERWGKPIERGHIAPREIEPVKITVPDEYFREVDTTDTALKEATEIARKRIKKQKGTQYIAKGMIVALRAVSVRLPLLQPVIEPLLLKLQPTNDNMPKNEAKKFLQKFAQTAGIMKWVYLVAAIAVFAATYFMPEALPVIIGLVYAAQAYVDKVEGDAAEEESMPGSAP